MSTPAKARRVKTAVPWRSVHSPGALLSRMESDAMGSLLGARFPLSDTCSFSVFQDQIEFGQNYRDLVQNACDGMFGTTLRRCVDQIARADRNPERCAASTVGLFHEHRLSDVTRPR